MTSSATICVIRENCLLGAPIHPCKPEDLECICEHDHSLEKNSLFDAHCLFEACHDEVDRGVFLRDLTIACERSGRQLVDIPEEWQPYLPFPAMTRSGSAVQAPTSATAALGVTSVALSLSTTTTSSPTSVPGPSSSASQPPSPTQTVTTMTAKGLSSGGIAAICVVTVVLVSVLLILTYLYWKSRRVAKAKLAENARLRDHCSTEGFSQRIREILGEDEATSVGNASSSKNASSTGNRLLSGNVSSSETRSSSVYSRPQ
ncbi:hypothetical protein P153DRAFT_390693 [Dothidotthia symphoricarpi CBS 119687]|uniref:Uncharacterized protein n=1 Tax=Dothidotthia symphoricarpi CBS 119687 TaxID=1392245 RepID=A0A6A5ZZ34_9PLEO|nr:uncharacterized protein P153DRAFT_390693 [Dothidotthia symphoricarpi CBS 119687]KAF2124143.1 hypothetical protein P153DRAFT_390693 [Dothidotthia symphoricarpi CBS 119687]